MSEIRVTKRPALNAPTREGRIRQRVAAYCRVSTLQEEQADSYETQCAYYRRLIGADPRLVLAGVYGDRGVSGLRADKRPEFQRMMRDCMNGEVDVVMTKSVSRFARNLADCVSCAQRLRQKGIPVLFEKEGFSSMDGDGEFILSVLASMAQEEVNNLSQHIRWSLEHRNAVGNPPRAARYGYRRASAENGQTVWQVYEPEASRVRLAFRMAARGESYRTVIAALDGMEIADGSDVRWSQARVYEMLKSEAYIGDILTNKAFRPDFLCERVLKNTGQRAQYYLERHHEPLVDRDTFERVGRLIRGYALRAKRGGRSGKP